MSYFIINVEHDCIVGTTDIPYASFTNRFVEASDDQISKFEALSASLPDGVYLQLSDLQSKPAKKKIADRPVKKATPETKQAIIDLMRSAKQKQRKNK
ncbi:hypothetical protein QO209_05235 [Pseudomonas citronellolis]|uniref:hypothetical protein n=1 Tax=Pseudomonas citronellolis TaxID=53408 RepID=UPI002648A6D9|nr:hypothetical protein [Pseudomonas citronellolis]MDN6871839.1 hypothetical protein [Pseudomonas citronellolis]